MSLNSFHRSRGGKHDKYAGCMVIRLFMAGITSLWQLGSLPTPTQKRVLREIHID